MKRVLPRGLFGRSLIIIVAPVVLLQAIVTYIFFERHYDIVTGRLSAGVARDVSEARRIELALRDRNRELRCLFNVFRLTEAAGQDLESMLHAVVAELPGAFDSAGAASALEIGRAHV